LPNLTKFCLKSLERHLFGHGLLGKELYERHFPSSWDGVVDTSSHHCREGRIYKFRVRWNQKRVSSVTFISRDSKHHQYRVTCHPHLRIVPFAVIIYSRLKWFIHLSWKVDYR
jgi:hypothetical protein